MRSWQILQRCVSEYSPDTSPRLPLENRVPTPRQAQWIRASTYLVPACIFVAGIIYFIKNPTWLDSVGSLLAFALALSIAFFIRKFIRSATLVLPTKKTIGMGLLILFFVSGSHFSAHFFEVRLNISHHSNWPGDLVFYLVAPLVFSPFALFFKIQKPNAEPNP